MHKRRAAAALCIAIGLAATGGALGQRPALPKKAGAAIYVEPGPVSSTILYATGQEVEVPTETVWRPVCGSPSQVDSAQLERIAAFSRQASAAHPAPPIEGGVASGSGGFDLIFNVTTSLPAGAAAALADMERYIESQFSDPVTVIIDFAYGPLPPGVLGATGSSYTNVTWDVMRESLQADMDADDTIQNHLPGTSTLPVRYDGASATVTNEDRVFITKANHLAAVGSISGVAASITYSSSFNWDYTPPNIDSGNYCFQTVFVHEVAHALGFTSGADFRVNDVETLDLYRFQRVDNTGPDYNPDDLAEFATTARMVDQDSPTATDNVNSDLISVEYQMSDGFPYQASHFHQFQQPTYIMEPARSTEQTFYPDFFRSADATMLDAIGWDFPRTNTTCQEATQAKCNSVRHFDNLVAGGPANPAYSCGSGGSHDGSMWFSFIAEATSANLSTCSSIGQDSTLAVYSGACGSLVEIACSEDGGCGSPGLSSLCVTGLTIGETYYVQVSARTPLDLGVYSLQVDCSCVGACCITPPADCLLLQEDDCAEAGGRFAGPDIACGTDVNGDGFLDVCEQADVKFSQLPTASEEDSASSADLADFLPDTAVADDFTSDGRPIHTVRWWGSALDPSVTPDGFLLSFHEPLTTGQPAAAALGLYFCGLEVVAEFNTPIAACDPHAVIEYSARLFDCCLIHAGIDSRSGATPAQGDAFHEELCFDYDLSIQAVAAARFDFQSGQCVATSTGNSALGDFWGWHTTSLEQGTSGAVAGSVAQSGSDWLYGPWSAALPACGNANAAFELVTTTPGGSGDTLIWHNGIPNDRDALSSQYGGEVTDWITVDDIEFPSGGTISNLYWYNEEEPDFTWAGRVRVEIYPDNGAMAPVGNSAPVSAMWVPDDGGSVMRTDVGPGEFFERYRYDVQGINIPVAPGRWWLGTATAGVGTGRAYWNSSHTNPGDVLFFGGEAYTRSPSAGIFPFRAWSTLIGGRKSDTSFAIILPGSADCNCNTVEDLQDIANLTSADCNSNGIPDECDDDCNGNLSPDECDVANSVSIDCQANGVPDECDIFFGDSPDSNANDIPDECCEAVEVPLPEATLLSKNRVITLRPTNPGKPTALRVRLVSLQHPNPPNAPNYPAQDFSAYEGTYRWVGPPIDYVDSTNPPTPFTAARLQCEPFVTDWGAISVLHIYGPEVMPSSAYEVYALEEECVLADQLAPTSTPLSITTSRWGDVASPFNPPATSSQPNSLDITSLVNKFKNLPGAPGVYAAKLQPAVINLATQINALDIANDVDAFKGKAYPYNSMAACPP